VLDHSARYAPDRADGARHFCGTHEVQSVSGRREGICQKTRHSANRTIQGKFTHHGATLGRSLCQLMRCEKHSECDRKIETRAMFAKWRRCEVHENARVRKLVTGGSQRASHTVASFEHGGVTEPYDTEGGQARTDIGLNLHGQGFHSAQGRGQYRRLHVTPLRRRPLYGAVATPCSDRAHAA